MKVSKILFDAGCLLSVVGIWPRYIEPNLLDVKRLKISTGKKSRPLKIAAFSDLHLNPQIKSHFLKKLENRIADFKPDLIVFTGDFLCESKVVESIRLKLFLNRLHAPLGCYAVLGNHDYASPISISSDGHYDVTHAENHVQKGFERLFKSTKLSGKVTDKAHAVPENDELVALLKETPFKLLNNETCIVGNCVNITGLGEYIAGRFLPVKAFKNLDPNLPGIVLAHNPDTIPHLLKEPGDLILCGHTHGGQVNLPWIWKRLTLMEHVKYKTGLFEENDKSIYVSRGVAGAFSFRWNARPELVLIEMNT